MFGRPVELLRVVKGHDLVSFAVNDVHWTVNILHPVNVWKLVERQGPPEVEDDPECRHQA